MSAASLFGFDKNEITNKKINNVMPSLYARHHDDFLKSIILIYNDYERIPRYK
jgi:hypothetical protein